MILQRGMPFITALSSSKKDSYGGWGMVSESAYGVILGFRGPHPIVRSHLGPPVGLGGCPSSLTTMVDGGRISFSSISWPQMYSASCLSRPAHGDWRMSSHGRQIHEVSSVFEVRTSSRWRTVPAPLCAPRAGHRTARVSSGRRCGGALPPPPKGTSFCMEGRHKFIGHSSK